MQYFKNAYTFIECLLVLTLLAMMTALSIPAIQLFRDRLQAQLLVSRLTQALLMARQAAMIKQQAVFICGSHDFQRCEAGWSQGMLIYANSGEKMAAIQYAVPHGQLYWRGYPFYRHVIRFMPMTAETDNGMFWYCPAGQALPVFAISLNRAGRSHVLYPDEQGHIHDAEGHALHCVT